MRRMLLRAQTALEYENYSEKVQTGARLSNSSLSCSKKEIVLATFHY